jgi:tripartite-type tricarboxylate transporter receptor subunit TctC
MKKIASTVLALGTAFGLTALMPLGAAAQGYPNKPIKIIVAYPAGQGTDIATRYLAEQMSRELGQPVVIDNKPGAGGNLGTELAARAPADGYTLTMGTNATHVLNQFLYARLAYEPEQDFVPVALVGTFPMVVAVNPASPIQNTADLLGEVRRNARGADVALPSTSARLVVELLKERSGVALFGVPYKGASGAVADVMGGQVPVIVDTPTSLRPLLSGGKLRAIAVTSRQPSALVPGIKTVAEQGHAGFEVVAWNALYAPKGTPAEVVNLLNKTLNKVLQQPESRQKLLDLGFEPAGGPASQLEEFARGERSKWKPIIAAAGIRVD